MEIGADLGGHIGLFLAVAYLLVSVLATRDQTGLVVRFTTVGAHLSPQWLDCGPSRAGLELAGVVVLVRTGPRLRAIAGCTQLDPLEMAHAAVVVGARSGDFERWDHCSQITSEGSDRLELTTTFAP